MNVKIKMTDRQVLSILWLISLLALSLAYLSELFLGLEPCPLCIYQRIPYGLVILLVPFIFIPRWGKLTTALLVLMCLIFITGAGISFYHVGVEQFWWGKPEICGAPVVQDDSFLEFKRQVLATTAPPDCSEIQWEMFGISMAGYNFLLSLFLLGLSSFPLIRKLRK